MKKLINKLWDLLPLNFELCNQLYFIELLHLEKCDEYLIFKSSVQTQYTLVQTYIRCSGNSITCFIINFLMSVFGRNT